MIRNSEEELLIEVQEHPENFEKLYDRYYFDLFHFINRKINNKETSVKITQRIFLTALKEIHKTSNASFANKIYRLATKYCDKHFNVRGNIKHVDINDKAAISILKHVSLVTDVKFNIKKLRNVINKFSFREIQLLELRFVDEKTFSETGYILNTSETVVRRNTYNLLGKLNTLMKYDHEESIQYSTNTISQDEIISCMNFNLLWRTYNQQKTSVLEIIVETYEVVNAKILKRLLRTAGAILLLMIFWREEEVGIKTSVQKNIIEVPVSRNTAQDKDLIEKSEKELAFSLE